jgi:hypothetical protein
MKDLKTKVQEVVFIYTKMKKGTNLEEIGRLLNGFEASDIAKEVDNLVKECKIIIENEVISLKLS